MEWKRRADRRIKPWAKSRNIAVAVSAGLAMTEVTTDKAALQKLVKMKSERVQFVPHEQGKSLLWRSFKRVMLDGVVQRYARCDVCDSLISYSGKTGTGSLLRHNCSVKALQAKTQGEAAGGGGSSSRSDQREATKTTSLHLNKGGSQGVYSEEMKKKFPPHRKRQLADREVAFVTKDLRPLDVVDGEGFLELAQALIDIGADYGKLLAKDFLAGSHALARIHIPKLYENIKVKVCDMLTSEDVAFTTDLSTWGDNTPRTFASLTGHFVSDVFQVKSVYLGCRELADSGNSRGNLIENLVDLLTEYTDDRRVAETKMMHSFIVMDPAFVVGNTLHGLNRLACGCYTLNQVLNDVIEKIPEIRKVIEDAEELIVFLKASGLNSELPMTMKQDVSTRWNSTYTMLKNIDSVYDEVQLILLQRDEMFRLGCIVSRGLLTELTEFLEIFKVCSDSMSCTSRPTLNEFVLWKLKLQQHCQPKATESDFLQTLRAETLVAIKTRLIPHQLHYVALFLDPNFKSLKMLNDSERALTINATSHLLRNIKNEATRKAAQVDSESPKPPKKVRATTTFSEFLDCNMVNSDDEDDELARYQEKRTMPGSITDVLEYWSINTEFPTLRQLAKRILAIPASSTPTNDTTLGTSSTLEERRSILAPEHADQILFLHKNLYAHKLLA